VRGAAHAEGPHGDEYPDSPVISDITRVTGMSILRAILAGERDCIKLAQMRHPQIKSSAQDIAKALEGDYHEEHLFALQTALELYDSYQFKINAINTSKRPLQLLNLK